MTFHALVFSVTVYLKRLLHWCFREWGIMIKMKEFLCEVRNAEQLMNWILTSSQNEITSK